MRTGDGNRFVKIIFVGTPGLLLLLILLQNQVTLLKYGHRELASKTNSLTQKALVVAGTLYDSLQIAGNSFLILLDQQPVLPESKIESIYLQVEPGSIERMASNFPSSAKERYYRARLLYPDGQWRRINYRFRGRSIWHFDPAKPSLRLKLSRNAPLELQRHINLVNPEDRPMIANILGEYLAQKLGVLTHDTKFVRLFIDGKYRGVYHQTTHEDERWLYLKQRTPGPVYIGNDLKEKWSAEDFITVGKVGTVQKDNPLERMIEAVYLPNSPDRYRALWNVLSFYKYARLHAAMSLAGSNHTDFEHNQLFY